MGRISIAERFGQSAGARRNLFDPGTQTLRGKNSQGRWLDRFFTRPVANPDKHLGEEALFGQYAHGNEPSHHTAWLHAYSDRPQQGHARVAEVVRRFYATKPDGIVCNDDAGQMSAWLVFAMLGFFPAEPMKGQHVVQALENHLACHRDLPAPVVDRLGNGVVSLKVQGVLAPFGIE
jgi:putative alpha-1,2-mannosidase